MPGEEALRISLEDRYFEVCNQSNVKLVHHTIPIEAFMPTGISSSDGQGRYSNVIVLAAGFDSITGSTTQIPITGTDPASTIKQKWQNGTYTYLSVATPGYPNLFFTYGSKAPTAFATGPSSAETQSE